MKKKQTDISKKDFLKSGMIPLHPKNEFTLTNEKSLNTKKAKISFDTNQAMINKLKNFGFSNLKNVTPYLTLSARATYVSGKGYINAMNCQAVFPDGPNIDFPWWTPQNQSLPTAGKIELWLTDLKNHQNLTVEIRTSGYSQNSASVYEIRSSITPGLYGYFPIKLDSKIDLFFPDINFTGDDPAGLALITIEAMDMSGSWIFHDLKVNIID